MTGPGTLDLQAEMIPDVREMLEDFGRPVTLVTGTGSTSWGTPASTGTDTKTVQAVLMPATDRARQIAAASALPIPSFVAYLLIADVPADLSTPGWYLQDQGRNYYPTRDARDAGGQGVAWICELGSPGEVTSGDTSEPGWTG